MVDELEADYSCFSSQKYLFVSFVHLKNKGFFCLFLEDM